MLYSGRMSIQDDIFDIEAEVKGTDAEEAFVRIINWASNTELRLEMALQERSTLINAIKIVDNFKYE